MSITLVDDVRSVPPAMPHPPDGRPKLHVRAWIDPLIDEMGHDPRSLYVERYWLPVLGPPNILWT